MNEVRDLIGVAWAGLKARKIRTLLIMLGPVIGVAAMVSAVGLTESAKGALQAQLSQLGTNLIIAQAGGTFGSQNPTFPSNAVQRVENVSTVTSAAATTNLSGVISLPIQGASSYYEAFPVPVRAADDNLPSVLDVPLLDGRWLNRSDSQLHLRSVVLGSGIARQYGYLPGEVRTILLNGTNFGVVGVLGPVALDPDLDNAAFVTQWAAKHILGTNGLPNQLYIRAVPGTTQGTANAIPTAINLGGPDQVSTQDPQRRAPSRSAGQQNPPGGRVAGGSAGLDGRRHRHRQCHVDLRHSAVGRDRDSPCRGPQPFQDRRTVPARVACSSACWVGCIGAVLGVGVVYVVVRLRRLGRRHRLRRHTHLDGSCPLRVRGRRPVSVDQGRTTRAARDASSRVRTAHRRHAEARGSVPGCGLVHPTAAGRAPRSRPRVPRARATGARAPRAGVPRAGTAGDRVPRARAPGARVAGTGVAGARVAGARVPRARAPGAGIAGARVARTRRESGTLRVGSDGPVKSGAARRGQCHCYRDSSSDEYQDADKRGDARPWSLPTTVCVGDPVLETRRSFGGIRSAHRWPIRRAHDDGLTALPP